MSNHKHVITGIILTDDDQDDRLIFSDAMSEAVPHLQLKMIENGPKLMDYLAGTKEEFNQVLFLDLNLPLKSGKECLLEIRADPRLQRLPIIIYSTSINQNYIDEAYKSGANLYVQKPNSFEKLKDILNTIASMDWEQYIPRPVREKFLMFDKS